VFFNWNSRDSVFFNWNSRLFSKITWFLACIHNFADTFIATDSGHYRGSEIVSDATKRVKVPAIFGHKVHDFERPKPFTDRHATPMVVAEHSAQRRVFLLSEFLGHLASEWRHFEFECCDLLIESDCLQFERNNKCFNFCNRSLDAKRIATDKSISYSFPDNAIYTIYNWTKGVLI